MADEFLDPFLEPSPYGVIWHAPGSKTYNLGVDRGMIYIGLDIGVPWVGLVSIEESPNGGELVPIYIDGIRRRQYHVAEEYAATITAFTAPVEFVVCEGELQMAPGLFLGQQTREPFHLSYRSFIGNDTEGMMAHYQLHFVYNAMTSPSSRSHKTLEDSSMPDPLSWSIETVPIEIDPQVKPTAHIKVDTRYTDRDRIEQIQKIIYGFDTEPPRMIGLTELLDILRIVDAPMVGSDVPWDPEEDPEEIETPEEP